MDSILSPGILNCTLDGIAGLFNSGRKITRYGQILGNYTLNPLIDRCSVNLNNTKFSFAHQVLTLSTVVKNETTGEVIGGYKSNLLGTSGTLELNGRIYNWDYDSSGSWGMKKKFTDDKGNKIVMFNKPWMTLLNLKIEILPNQVLQEDLALLLFFACYLISKAYKQ